MSLQETLLAYMPVSADIDHVDTEYFKKNFNPNLDSDKIASIKSGIHLVSWSSQSLDFRDKDIPELMATELHLLTDAILRSVRNIAGSGSFVIIYGYETENLDWRLTGHAYEGSDV